MSNKDRIILKKSSTAGKVPHWSMLEVGELAVNFPDAKLFTKDTANNIIEIGGGSGGSLLEAGDGVVIAENEISVDNTVVRTTGDQVIHGDITFTGSVNVDLNAATLTGKVPVENLPSSALIGDTTYDAGNGISLVGTTFSLSDERFTSALLSKLNSLQNVNLTGGTNVTVSGTYPNLTISSTDTNTTYTAGTGITLTGTTFSLSDERFTSALLTKLNGIESGAQVNVPTNITVSGTGGTRTIASSTGTNGTITFTASDVGAAPASHTHFIANVTGLQSALDSKVDDNQVLTDVPLNAVFTDTTYSAGTGVALTGTTFSLSDERFTSALLSKLNGIESGAQVNVPTNLGYTASTRVLTSSTGANVTIPEVTITNAGLMIASDKVKLNSLSNVNLTGGTNVTVSGTYPNLTISSTDTNTTYTAGTGITLTGTTFSLSDERFTSALLTKLNGIAAGAQVNVPTNLGYTASTRTLTSSTGSNVALPQVTTSVDGLMIAGDKVKLNSLSNVNLTGGTNVTVSGTYPNLTISSTDTNTTYTAGTGVTLTGTTFSLSDERFTSALLSKLNGIESGAQVNVPTNLGLSGTGNSRTITSSTGVNVSIPVVTTTNAGFMSTSDKTKLDGVAAGAQVNVPTNLGYTATTRVLTSSTGTNVTLPEVTTSNAGLMSASDKTKLNGIAAGAQVNTVTSVAGKTGAVTLAKGDVGLGSVDNTSDLNKPISTATQTALTNGFNNLNASKLTTGTVPNARLTASTTSVAGIVQLNNTLTSTSTAQALTAAQGKVLKDAVDQLAGSADWVDITTTTNVTLADNQRVRVDSAGLTITLPASPSVNTKVSIAVGDFKNTVINRNGKTIMGKSDNAVINRAYATATLYYDGATWRFS